MTSKSPARWTQQLSRCVRPRPVSTQCNSSAFAPISARRALHTTPEIGSRDHDKRLKDEGIPGLFSREAYDVAWTQYQQFMVDRLNAILANDPQRAQMKIKELAIATAREPSLAPTFNYASMAHNNHFFFSCLGSEETEMPAELEKNIARSFGSVDTLRDSMLATASGMFGPGFVWLVQEQNPSDTHPATVNTGTSDSGPNRRQLHFRLLTTYLAGSPYPGAHTRQQGLDMNVHNMRSAAGAGAGARVAQNAVGAFGRSSASARGMDAVGFETDGRDDAGGDRRRFGGADVVPLLCVNTWEHCYLADFGVAGKRAYLARWWARIDWARVQANCWFPSERDQFGQYRVHFA